MKILLIPLFNLIYTILMSLFFILIYLLAIIFSLFWNFKINKTWLYYEYEPYFNWRNLYSPYKHKSLNNLDSTNPIYFKTVFHYLWGYPPLKNK